MVQNTKALAIRGGGVFRNKKRKGKSTKMYHMQGKTSLNESVWVITSNFPIVE